MCFGLVMEREATHTYTLVLDEFQAHSPQQRIWQLTESMTEIRELYTNHSADWYCE